MQRAAAGEPGRSWALSERMVTTMLMSKRKTAVAFIVLVGLISAGAAARTYSVWAAEEPDAKKAVAVPAKVPAGERLKGLLQERRDLAASQFELWQKGELQWKESLDKTRQAFGLGGTGDRDVIANLHMLQDYYDKARAEVNEWAQRLLMAELDLCENRAARLAAYERHLVRMKKLEASDKRVDEVAAVSKFHRLSAEVLLERAKND